MPLKKLLPFLAASLLAPCLMADESNSSERAAADAARLAELDSYWATVARAVKSGDFALYRSTCHPEGILVAGTRKNSEPLSQALARWKKEFDATRDGTRTSGLALRFSQRIGDATTAHETGMFLYTATTAEGKKIREFIHLEALLTKTKDGWKILMEYQKSVGTEALDDVR